MAKHYPDEFFTDIEPITRAVPAIYGEIDVSSGTLTYRTCRTNADRIRAMSDEELAEWIISQTEDDTPHWLDWLQSPADGGVEDD